MTIDRSPALPLATRALRLRPTLMRYILACGVVILFADFASAQLTYERHSLIRGDMPPGLAAESYRLAHPELTYHTQPVRVIVPGQARIEIGGGGGAFIESYSSRVNVGMRVGPVYRFKVTDIPGNLGSDLYPSIEILDKLNPPAGLENDFPIQINISQDDLEQAIEGRLVTKVVYLENPKTALPHRHVENHQPYFDVSGGEDPLRAAERLGRPMAILRIGSRIPATSDDYGFDFNAPAPVMLSETSRVDPPQAGNKVERQAALRNPSQSSLSDVSANHQYSNSAEFIEPKNTPQRHLPPIINGKVMSVELDR